MKTEADSRQLAESLVSIGNASGVRTEAVITAMDAPLGRAVGNALEVIECLDVLKGDGPGRSGRGVGRADRAHAGARRRWQPTAPTPSGRCARAIASGAGARSLSPDHRSAGRRSARRRRLHAACRTSPIAHVVAAARAGIVSRVDAELVGRASVALGAGRDRVEDPVDPAVGIMVAGKARRSRTRGRRAPRTALSRSRRGSRPRLRLAGDAIAIGDEPPAPRPPDRR